MNILKFRRIRQNVEKDKKWSAGTKNDYLVDARSACCSCPAGMFGKFCKHQFAVAHYFNVYLQNFPAVTTKDRHEIAHLALGDKTPTIDFYQPLIENCSTPIVQPDVEEQAIVPIATTVEVSSEKENEEIKKMVIEKMNKLLTETHAKTEGG
ncbi:hypothetical protein JTE90_009430 [Oedothorax gibbosus]|uniref:SWIM-type domain-containing protein n=1 Tax=Oedothorax gibbosus TaxID=931172 RepID=A0AAV6VUU8_9ARAC|nr:hypothetical protein JTE90_009430 [Oedothorax gibbosus]